MPTPTSGILVPGISRRTSWQVLWKATSPVDLGLLDDVDTTGIKFVQDGIMTGTTGKKNKLGDRLVGVEATIKIQMRQLNATQYAALCPWSTVAPFSLFPPLNADMYQYSDLLVLHPVDMLAVTTEDIIFPHAVPMQPPSTLKRGGDKDDVWDIVFQCYPDRTVMSTTPLVITPGTLKGT